MLIELTMKIDDEKFAIRAESIFNLKAERDGTRVRTNEKPDGHLVIEKYEDLKRFLNVKTITQETPANSTPVI